MSNLVFLDNLNNHPSFYMLVYLRSERMGNTHVFGDRNFGLLIGPWEMIAQILKNEGD